MASGLSDDPQPSRLTGVAATLQRLRETGQLGQKKAPQQIGRGKALPADDDDDDNNGRNRMYHPNVKLAYTDDQGNELTPKEAFRMLSHKFHGNNPGKNKNEKRLMKILEARRLNNLRDSGDTPLAAVAALRKETQKLGSAHVVLSGTQAFHTSASASAPGSSSATMADADVDSEKRSEKKRSAKGKRQPEDAGRSIDDPDNPTFTKMDEKVTFTIGAPGMKPTKIRRRQ